MSEVSFVMKMWLNAFSAGINAVQTPFSLRFF